MRLGALTVIGLFLLPNGAVTGWLARDADIVLNCIYSYNNSSSNEVPPVSAGVWVCVAVRVVVVPRIRHRRPMRCVHTRAAA